MAYARMGAESDVYVYQGPHRFHCCGCILAGYEVTTDTPEQMAEHLQKHQREGHKVPTRAIARLMGDKDWQSK